MNPCEVGFHCPYCISNLYGELWCTYSKTILVSEYECPLVEEYSNLFYWLHNCDNVVTKKMIENFRKKEDKESKELCDKMLGKRMRIEEQKKELKK